MPVQCDLNGWWPPGCGLVSQANDGFLGAVTALFANILQNIASWIWSFITGAFSVSNVDDSQWIAVQGLTNWWVVVMMTPLVVAMILQLLSGLISQQPRRLVRALVGGAAAIPDGGRSSLPGPPAHQGRRLRRRGAPRLHGDGSLRGVHAALRLRTSASGIRPGLERRVDGSRHEQWRSRGSDRHGDGRHRCLDLGFHSDVLDDLPVIRAHRACRRRPGRPHAHAVGENEVLGTTVVRDRRRAAPRQASGRDRSGGCYQAFRRVEVVRWTGCRRRRNDAGVWRSSDGPTACKFRRRGTGSGCPNCWRRPRPFSKLQLHCEADQPTDRWPIHARWHGCPFVDNSPDPVESSAVSHNCIATQSATTRSADWYYDVASGRPK